RDWISKGRRQDAARHATDLSILYADGGAPGRHHIVGHDQSHEPSGHATVAAMEHADDDLLADVTALGETDGTRFETGFERNGLLVHVAMKQRHAGLDPDRLGRAGG